MTERTPMTDAELFVVRNCVASEGRTFRMGPLDTRAILARLDAAEAERDAAVTLSEALSAGLDAITAERDAAIARAEAAEAERTDAYDIGERFGRRRAAVAIVAWIKGAELTAINQILATSLPGGSSLVRAKAKAYAVGMSDALKVARQAIERGDHLKERGE